MVDAVSTVSGTSTIAALAQQSTVSVPSGSAQSTSQASTPAASSNTNVIDAAVTQLDPSSGVFVIAQYGSDGNVVGTTPQASALAYLRDGLTADGLSKQSVVA